MKNNFDLTNYMKSNKVGAYQQLNEMWYQDINQALGDFNVIKEEAIEETPLHPDTEEDENGNTYFTEDEMEEGKKKLAFVIPCPDAYDIEEEAEHFQYLLDKAGVKAKVKANQVGEEAEVYTKDEKKARKVIEKNGYQIGWNDDIEDNGEGESTQSDDQEQSHYLDIPTGPDKGWKNEDDLKEMGGVKTIGDAGKMATPNSRPNLGRHRSSDMLDKMSKKDHKTNTVVGAKAAAYKAPHMKEEEFKSFGDPDLTLNDLNNNIVITPFELEKTWKDVYGEDFKTEYSGAHSYLSKNYKNFTIADLVDVWEKMYGEDFLYEYSGIAKWLFSNQGKMSSKDKVAPKMNEDESEKEKAMYANTDPNIADPINQDDDIFAGSEKANWKDNYGNETSEWDTEIAGQTVKGWTAEETQGGAIAWQNPRYPNADIYATPGWEGVDGIALELHDSEDGFMDEPKIQKVVGAGTDLWKTKEGYMALMAKVFTTLEKMLKPSEEMAEDDGTGRQINHDFNDDISIDPSEFEDAIQEGTQDWNHTWEYDIVDLLDDGMSKPEILTHFTDILKIARSSMGESIENEDADPFGSIKTGIDKITMGDDDMDMSDDDRFDQLGGDKIKAGIEGLMGDGFDYREILQFVKDTIASKRNY